MRTHLPCLRALIIYILLATFLPVPSAANRLQGLYSPSRLGVAQGLANSYVVDLAQDGSGCIWIATESGLSRYDGHRFTTFRKQASGLCSNELNTLYYDRQSGLLWIGSQREGVSRYDTRRARFDGPALTMKNGLIADDVVDILPTADGKGVWIVHYHFGLDRWDRESGKITPLRLSKHSDQLSIWCAADDGQGHLYVGHEGQGMTIVDLKTGKTKNFRHNAADPRSLPDNTVRSLLFVGGQGIFAGTRAGLVHYSPATGRFSLIHGTEGIIVTAIERDRSGNLLLGTDDNGLLSLNLRSRSVERVEASPETVRAILTDSYGNLWTGSSGEGLTWYSHVEPMFSRPSLPDIPAQSDTRVYDVGQMGGVVWAACGRGFTVEAWGRAPRYYNLPAALGRKTYVSTILPDGNNAAWLGLSNGAIVRASASGAVSTSHSLSTDRPVMALLKAPDGSIVAGTNKGLWLLSPSGQTRRLDVLNRNLADLDVRSLALDAQGRFWAGTFGRGIHIFSPQGRLVKRLDVESGFVSNAINDLQPGQGGRMWVATRAGLLLFNNTAKNLSYRVLDNRLGLANDNVKAILTDRHGHLWISTSSGISRWDGKRFVNYDQRFGVPPGDFYSGAACTDSRGMLFFGSTGGLCCFNPDRITTPQKLPPVRFTGVTLLTREPSGKSLPLSDLPTLSYDENNLRVEFGVTDAALAKYVIYSYCIEGLSDNWYYASGDGQVTLSGLEPGSYNLKIRARLPGQPWGEAQSLHIVISPPWYLAWYSKLLYFILCIAAAALTIRFYKHRLDLLADVSLERHRAENVAKLNAERLRFFTNIAHELRTPLTLIVGPLNDLLKDSSLDSRLKNKLTVIASNAKRLHNLVDQILEFRKTETENRKLKLETDDLSALVMQEGTRYMEGNTNADVEVKVSVPEGSLNVPFDKEAVTIIIDNLMSNALKYTKKGCVALTLTADAEGRWILTVSDTGCGIPREALPHIFDRYYQAGGRNQLSGTGIGLALVSNLAKLHALRLRVDSEPGKGTTFSVEQTATAASLGFEAESTATLNGGNGEARTISATGQLTENAKAETASEANENAADAAQPNGETDSREGNILLIIDDNADIRGYIRSSFEDKFKVIAAADGEEGYKAATRYMPTVIVSDVMMPGMDGFELCRKLRADMHTSHIPIILLTAKASIQDREEGYAAGADSFITKPFSANLLAGRIDNILAGRKRLVESIVAAATPAPAESGKPAPGTESKPAEEAAPLPPDTAPASITPYDRKFIEKMEKLVSDNLDNERLDVDWLAAELCMSHSTLYRKVKGLTGHTVNETIRAIRLRRACEMISEGGLSLAEIADRTGFSTPAYFRQCFKDEYGMTPTEYAKKRNGERDGNMPV